MNVISNTRPVRGANLENETMKFTVTTRFYDDGNVFASYREFKEGDEDERKLFEKFDEYVEIVYDEQHAKELVEEAENA